MTTKVATGERYLISFVRNGNKNPIVAAPKVYIALARSSLLRKKIPITTRDKKSSATARVSRNSLTDGLTRFPRKLNAPIANATSVGIATAHALAPVCRAIKMIAGKTIPESAQSPGSMISFGLLSPSRISRPIKTKKVKVNMWESTSQCYAQSENGALVYFSLLSTHAYFKPHALV